TSPDGDSSTHWHPPSSAKTGKTVRIRKIRKKLETSLIRDPPFSIPILSHRTSDNLSHCDGLTGGFYPPYPFV
ncbi:hypothetical protein, partial [Bosea thiooxidans]